MNYLKNKNYFCIDCHCHFSPEKAYPVIKKAMNKGLDALTTTEFISKFLKPENRLQNILKNKNKIFPKNYAVFQINEYSLQIMRNKLVPKKFGPLYEVDKLILFNSQEINTLDGHLLALFTDKFYSPGLPLTETVQMLIEDSIPFILPHVYSRMFKGVGEKKVLEIYEQVPKGKFALEDNGQISWLFRKWNKKAHKLAKDLNLPILGNSDGHLDYPFQSRTVGNVYSAVLKYWINKNPLKESFSNLIAIHKDEIRIGGKHRSTLGVGFWMAFTPRTGLGILYSKLKKN